MAFMLFFSFCPMRVFGQTWGSVGLEAHTVSVLTADKADSTVLYAGSFSNFSLGTTGGLFKTTNAGATWDTLLRGVTVVDVDLHPRISTTIYVTLGINSLTEPGIVKSTDGGSSWALADSGIAMDWEVGPRTLAIDYAHPETLYAGTRGFYPGKLYKSTDGGKYWFVPSDTLSLSGVSAIGIDPFDSQVIMVGTGSGRIWRSSDGGSTWAWTGLDAGIVSAIEISKVDHKIHVASSWLPSAPVGYYSSIDGGMTWQSELLGLPDTANIADVLAVPSGHGETLLAAANWRDSGGVYIADPPNGWQRIGVDGSRINALEIAGSNLYAGGNGVHGMRLVVSVAGDERARPARLHLRNYPNPSNHTTSVEVDLPANSRLRLRVYDLLGREVAVLADGALSRGVHLFRWDATGNPSGVYFCRLDVTGSILSKKILLLR
jgi:photosystem II stability/assembly factor-like uncharacterized protein